METIKELYGDISTVSVGIFKLIDNPIFKDDFKMTSLDFDFFSRYGNRYASPLLTTFIEYKSKTTWQKELTNYIYSKHKVEIEKLYAIGKLTYDPISNYDMVENEVSERIGDDNKTYTGKETINNELSYTGKETTNNELTFSGKEKTTSNNGKETTSSSADSNYSREYAYNTSSPQKLTDESAETVIEQNVDATSELEYTDRKDTTVNSTEYENRKDTTVNEKTFENRSDNTHTTNNDERTLTRKGNVGVTTSQQMIESELKLWKWNFIQSVFEIYAKELSIPIY